MKISEKQLVGLIKESVENELLKEEKEFDPYNYSFEGFGDGEFESLYDDEDQAEMERELVDLISDGEMLFNRIKEVIETSKYYAKDNSNESVRKYLDKIEKIIEMIKNFWV